MVRKILVIDDRQERHEIYKNLHIVFERYTLDFIDEAGIENLTNEYISKFDLVLLDIRLNDNWRIDSNYVGQKIRNHNTIIPIILVTSEWNKSTSSYISKLTKEYDIEKLILNFNDLVNTDNKPFETSKPTSALKYFAEYIDWVIEDRNELISLGKKDDEALIVLHISDLQQGGSTVKENLLEPDSIAQMIKNSHKKVDFIIVSGDITETGTPSEFIQAQKWLEELCERLGWEKPYERLLLIPGNHDVYIPTLELYNKTFSSEKKVHEDSTLNLEWINKYALSNFKDFAYNLTKNSYYLTDYLSWVEKRYSHLGIAFVGLNSLSSVSHNNMYYGPPSDVEYKYLRKQLREIQNENVFTVGITHHEKIVEEELYTEFIQSHPSPSIIHAGHIHKYSCKENNNFILTAPTSSLKAEKRYQDTNRGFLITEYKRKHNQIIGFSNYVYSKINNKWMNTGKLNYNIVKTQSQFEFVKDVQLPSNYS